MKISGKNSAFEKLRSDPRSIKKIEIQEGFAEASYVRKKAKQWGIPVIVLPKSKMENMRRNANTQGILVTVDDFAYVMLRDMIDQALDKKRTIVFLDGLNDPQNLGAIIRSLACLGRFSIVLPTHDSVSVTEAVLRVASGGDSHVPIAQVSNLNKAIREAKDAGFTIAGTVVKDGTPITEVTFPYPLGLVIGSEQKGIRDVIRQNIDLAVTIPMHLDRLSFNVAHATAIIAYEITRQRHKK